jgi:poly(A) polymerase
MYPVSLDFWLPASPIIRPRLYLVGGTVRDLILGVQPKDLDLVCRHAKSLAYRLGARKNATVVSMGKKPAEPCYRVVAREAPDHFLDIAEMRGQTIYDDLGRRDFTINAIAAEVRRSGVLGPLIDPFGGVGDIEQRTIKMTGEGSLVSDPLRILRAVRFSAALGFQIEPQTRGRMRSGAELLGTVSAERVMAELLLILKTPQSSLFIRGMDQLGIMDALFPEIVSMKGCTQNGFHHLDVWEHSLLAAAHCEHILNNATSYFGTCAGLVLANLAGNNRIPLLKLSALLHDIGKPLTRGTSAETAGITFYKHEEAGAKLVDAIAGRMKLSGKDREYLKLLVGEHIRVLSLAGHSVRPAVRLRWFRKMKEDAVPAIIMGIADVESSLGKASTGEWRKGYRAWSKNIVRDYYETVRTRLASRNLIAGRDLIALGMSPGPEMGRILDMLRNAQDTGQISCRDDALALAKRLLMERITP